MLLIGLNLLNYIDRYILPGAQPLIQREYGWNDQKMGALTTALFVVYMLVAPATGWLGDRFPRKPLIIGGAILWSLATLGTAWVHDYWTLYLRHGFQPIGETEIHVLMERPPAVAPKIRSAVRGDVTAIVQVRREAILARAASHYDPVLLNDWAEAGNAGRIAKRISDPDYRTLVAEAGGEMIGFVMVSLAKCELLALYARPNATGNVGRDLLAAIEQLAFQTVPFLVCEASLNAEGFYKANGYTAEGWKDFVTSSGLLSRVVPMKKQRPKAG